jgi:septal ring factor EnvC (AmiA/AmiB activator)
MFLFFSSNFIGIDEKNKLLETELAMVTKQLENAKKDNAEEKCKLKVAHEESKELEEKLVAAQERTKSLKKELDDLRHSNKSSLDQENIEDK